MNNRETKIPKNIIGRITSLFVKKTELSLLLIVLIIIVGLVSYIFLPKESLPEIVFPSLNIQTLYPGANAGNVESLVTIPLEDAAKTVDDLISVNSVSDNGFSFITLEFDESVNIDEKKVQLEAALANASLPANGFEPSVSSFKTSEIPLISLSLAGDYDLYELSQYASDLKNQLSSLDGVENVLIFGGSQREVQVLVDDVALAKAGFTNLDVSNAIKSANLTFPLGQVVENNANLSLSIDESINSLDEIKNIILVNKKNEVFTLDELASVVDSNKEVTGFNRSFRSGSSLKNAVTLSVIRENRKDVLGTSQAVKEAVDKALGTTIPADLEVVISRDTAVQVEDDLGSIQNNALSGLIVVVLVLLLFIGFREALIVALTIPLTLLATLAILGFFGITLNTFAILGLIVALGLLVDNTIIVMENMDRLRSKGISAKDSAIYGSNQVGYPIASATLTTLAAFFPLAILPGIIGAFINTIPRTIIITLITSLILAVTITPSVYYLVFKHKNKIDFNKPVVRWTLFAIKIVFVASLSLLAFSGPDVSIIVPILATVFFLLAITIKELKSIGIFNKKNTHTISQDKPSLYSTILSDIIHSRLRMTFVILVAIAVLASSLMLIVNGQLKIAFFPETEPRNLVIGVDTPSGTTLAKTGQIAGQVEKILKESPFVKQFSTTVGGNEMDYASISVDLNLAFDKANLADEDLAGQVDLGQVDDIDGFTIVEILRQKLALVDGAQITYEATGAGGPPVGKPIEVKIIGDNLEENTRLTNEFAQVLRNIDGVYNVESSIKEGGFQQVIDLDYEALALNGLSPAYIGSQIRSNLEGQKVSSINLDNELVDVRLISEVNDNPLTMIFKTPSGKELLGSQLFSLKEVAGITGITRSDGKRVITLSGDLEEGFNAAESLDVFKDRLARIPLPAGTVVNFDGEAAGISENFANLFRSMIIAIFLVFIILTVQFGSIKQPFIIIMTIPMALTGVLYGLLLTGNEFGFYAFMALVSLVGIAVNDAIVLIDYMNYLRKEGMDFYEAVIEGTKTRFNPVLATSLTTIGGILPLSYKNSYYAQFGYSLIFGLFVTTILTLVIIPIMYTLFESRKAKVIDSQPVTLQ